MQPSAIRLTFNPVRPRRVYSTAGPFLVAGTSLALSPAPHHSTGALRLDGRLESPSRTSVRRPGVPSLSRTVALLPGEHSLSMGRLPSRRGRRRRGGGLPPARHRPLTRRASWG